MPVYNAAGLYDVTVTAAALTESSQKKTPQLVLDLQLNGFHDKDGQVYEPEQPRFAPRLYISLTENAMGTPQQPGISMETLKALKFNGDFDDLGQFVGTELQCQCLYEPAMNNPHDKRENWRIASARKALAAVEQKVSKALNKCFGKFFTDKKPAKKAEAQSISKADVGTMPAEVPNGQQGEFARQKEEIPF